MKPVPFCRVLAPTAILVALATIAPTGGASAYTFKTLHSFCAEANCTDGQSPEGPLAMDAAGNIYGTTFQGGKNTCGTIFELSPPAGGAEWRYKILHNLCAGFTTKNGALPVSRLIIDTSGNLYGTTLNGGNEEAGVGFRLSPNADRTKWTYRKVKDLCDIDGCPGSGGVMNWGLTYAGAATGMPYDGTSPLYGQGQLTSRWYRGEVFALRPDQKHWHAEVLHRFCRNDDCTRGGIPDNAVIMDVQGNIFGTTEVNEITNGGLIFEVSPKVEGRKWAETVLYNFCETANCSDGSQPSSELLRDAQGNLFGTTYAGGNACAADASGCGVLFKLAPNGANSQYSVLYSFCAQSGCPDGASPSGPLVMDPAGAIYGATSYAGGTVFKFDGALTTLYKFCSLANCTDGEHPEGFTMDTSGNIFGVAAGGGAYGKGTVFELSP